MRSGPSGQRVAQREEVGATEVGRPLRVTVGDRLREHGVRLVVLVAAVHAADAEHLDHGLPQSRGEAVEQIEQDRVVCCGDDRPVEDRVGVDVALDIRAVRSTIGQSTAEDAQIGGRAS